MVLIALLVLSLVCLVFGLVLTNATWLIASLIATGGAAFLLWRTAPSLRSRPAAAGPAHAGNAPGPAHGNPAGAATMPTSVMAPVVGAPVASPPAVAEPVPAVPAQTAAPLASAPPQPAAVATPPAAAVFVPAIVEAPTAPDVWVIDGRPRYHRVDCVQLVGQTAEPIPFAQAVEDGFIPCSLCAPSGS